MNQEVRTRTLALPDDVWRIIKSRAALDGVTMAVWLEGVVRGVDQKTPVADELRRTTPDVAKAGHRPWSEVRNPPKGEERYDQRPVRAAPKK